MEIPVLDGILQFKGRKNDRGASLETLFQGLGLSSSKKKTSLADGAEILK